MLGYILNQDKTHQDMGQASSVIRTKYMYCGVEKAQECTLKLTCFLNATSFKFLIFYSLCK